MAAYSVDTNQTANEQTAKCDSVGSNRLQMLSASSILIIKHPF